MGWLRRLFGRRQSRAEMQEEMEGHIAERAEQLLARGLAPEEARRQARVAFGNPQRMLERSVVEWELPWVTALWADLRLGFRRLLRSPGYAVTAVLTLALGIGANAAIFTVIDDAMLRSLPVRDPGQLVELGYRSPGVARFIGVAFWPVFERLQADLRGVSGVSGWEGSMVTFPDQQNTLRSIGADVVTGNAFSILGVKPFLGRLLTPADDVPGGPEGGWPVVLDYGFWLSNFRGDPSVIGRHLYVSDQPAVVVGVLPRSFFGLYVGEPQKLYLPMHFLSAVAASPEQDPYLHPDNFAVQPVARLRVGVTLGQLNAELRTMNTPMLRALLSPRVQNNPIFRNGHMAAQPLGRGFSLIEKEYSEPLFLLQGIALAVLLLCCVNLASLETARLEARRKDVALCAALGAGRLRLMQQAFTECLLLAVAGGALAAVIAWLGLRAMVAFLTPAGFADPIQLTPDVHVLWIAGGLALVTTLLFGAVPAYLTARVTPYGLIKGTGTGVRQRNRRFRVFIPVQFALALALVFTAGLFTRTLEQLHGEPLGFDPDHITGVTAQFQALKASPQQILLLYRSMLNALRATPGIEAASYTWVTPVSGEAPKITTASLARRGQKYSMVWNDVGDGYFSTLGMRMIAGRGFTPQDRDRTVCVVNEAAARELFGRGQPVGDSLEATDPADIHPAFTAECRVVGIVADARYASLREPPPPTVYFPITDSTVAAGGYQNNLVFLMRSQTEGEAANAYRAALRRYAPTTAYMVFFTLQQELNESLGSERLIAGLSSAFAGAALLLSGIGLFGVLALRVTQRRPEIGVRLAVGATRGQILTLILREALRLTAWGAAGGLALIAASSMFLRSFLYETSPLQASVVVGSMGALAGIAVCAALIPARRAAGLNPVEALRSE